MAKRNREGLIMNTAKILIVAVLLLTLPGISLAQNPPASGGEAMYRDYCGSCHGFDAKGNGPLVSVLKVHPTDLTLLSKQNNGVFPALRLSKVIDGREAVRAHGTAEMPVWGREFTLQEKGTMGTEKAAVSGRIQALVAFLDSIQQK